MAEAGDIVRISIPFTAGVAAAALVPEGPAQCCAAAFSIFSVCAAIAFMCPKGKSAPAASALFFFLGAFNILSSEIAFAGSRIPPAWTSRAMEDFCSLIDSVEFEYPQTGALVKALLTGRKDTLDAGTVELFRESGAAHILALSGLHLGVLYVMMSKLLSVFGNSRAAGIVKSAAVIASSGLYMTMTGASASIVRAFLFITVNEILRHCPRRRRKSVNVLCLALMIQLTANPAVIRSVGFQLSYLAMLGILTIYPRLEKWYPESFSFDLPRKIWKSAALSFSCQVFTAPIVRLRFGTFAKHFLLTNLISMPLAEMLIVSSVICLAGEAAGFCPEILKSPVDMIARTLMFCLKTVSTM